MTTLVTTLAVMLYHRGALPERVRVCRDTAAFRSGEVLTWCPVRRAFAGRAGFVALAEQVQRHWGDVYDFAHAEQMELAAV